MFVLYFPPTQNKSCLVLSWPYLFLCTKACYRKWKGEWLTNSILSEHTDPNLARGHYWICHVWTRTLGPQGPSVGCKHQCYRKCYLTSGPFSIFNDWVVILFLFRLCCFRTVTSQASHEAQVVLLPWWWSSPTVNGYLGCETWKCIWQWLFLKSSVVNRWAMNYLILAKSFNISAHAKQKNMRGDKKICGLSS